MGDRSDVRSELGAVRRHRSPPWLLPDLGWGVGRGKHYKVIAIWGYDMDDEEDTVNYSIYNHPPKVKNEGALDFFWIPFLGFAQIVHEMEVIIRDHDRRAG